MMADVSQELEALGSPATTGAASGGELLRLLSKFSSNFTAIIEGRGGQNDLKGHVLNLFEWIVLNGVKSALLIESSPALPYPAVTKQSAIRLKSYLGVLESA